MHVNEVLETCLYADDLGVAEKFYREVLGLRFVLREEGRHVFLRSGRGMVLLFRAEETLRADSHLPQHGSHGPTHVAFAVPAASLDEWVSWLREHRVEIERDHPWPNGARSLYFRDPAGNSLELASPRLWGLKERFGELSAPSTGR